MKVTKKIFDFEIGYLVKSPCKECLYRTNLPECADECGLLDRIQMILSRGISCTGKYHSRNI